MAACVHIGGQGGHLFVASRSIFGVNDVDGVRRGRGLVPNKSGFKSGVWPSRCLGRGRQVLEFPVVLELVAVFQSGSSCLEGALAVRGTAGADGHKFAAIKFTVGAKPVGGRGPCGAVVNRVVERRCASCGGVDTGHIGQRSEECALAFDVRVNSCVRRETRGWGVRIGTSGVDDTDVRVGRSRG